MWLSHALVFPKRALFKKERAPNRGLPNSTVLRLNKHAAGLGPPCHGFQA